MLVFNREKCITDLELHCDGYITSQWIDKCDGRIVNNGQIDIFVILPEWCDEVNIKFNLIPAEVEYIMQDDCTIDDINNSIPENIIDFLTPMYGRGTPECAEMTRRIERGIYGQR